jgi:predicted Zn-dependent protease
VVSILFLAMGIVGCSAGPSRVDQWVTRQGGVAIDARQARVDAVASRLLRGRGELQVHVHILANDAPCAYGWPNGQLFVTRGLVDRVTDEELSAALAHEMGHLLSDGHTRNVMSLRGCQENLDAEQRADAVGVEFMRLQGLPPQSMITMLKKVCESGTLSPACRDALDHRITLLESRIESRLDTP